MVDVKLILGDCLTVMRGMEVGSVDAILTDLPYGTTACKWDTVIPFASMWEVVRHVLKPRGVFVTTASQPFTSALVMSNPGWFKYEWIWGKSAPTGHLNARKQPLRDHENILVFARGETIYNPQGLIEGVFNNGRPNKATKRQVYGAERLITEPARYGNYPRTQLTIPVERGEHPTQKPVALYEYLIRTYTNEGETVLDMCAGSGTTGVAAVNTGRNFIGIEKEADYFSIMERRIADAQAQPSLIGG